MLVHMHPGIAPASLLLTFALSMSSVVACGTGEQPLHPLELADVAQPILGGRLDTEHPEVMFLFDLAGSACTGTNLRTEDGRGFLLTAAHCVTIDVPGPGVIPIDPEQFVVLIGDDVAESDVFFPVEEIAIEPGYDGGAPEDDIAIVRYFFGTETPPPTIAPLAPNEDDLRISDDLLLVGYGVTEDGDFNTERRQLSREIDDLNSELIAFSQADGRGPCFGDSGGPGLVEVGGQERVGLVISTGFGSSDIPCIDGFTIGVRVSAYDDFIEAFLAQDLPEAALAGSAD